MDRPKKSVRRLGKRNAPCWYCGQRLLTDAAEPDGRLATLDHKTPLSRGGSDTAENKVNACLSCNHKKGDMTVEEYRAALGLKAKRPVVFYGEAVTTPKPDGPLRARKLSKK